MHSSSSITTLLVVALVSSSVAAPIAAPEPFLGWVLGLGGVAAGIGITGHAAQDKQRHAKMDWVSPNQQTVWQCGTVVPINVNTFGFGSFWGLSNSKITLMDSNGGSSSQIMSRPLAEFIKEERTLGIGRARNGKGSYQWRIPSNIQSGHYLMEFESANAWNWDRSRIRFTSPAFEIQCGPRPGSAEDNASNYPPNHQKDQHIPPPPPPPPYNGGQQPQDQYKDNKQPPAYDGKQPDNHQNYQPVPPPAYPPKDNYVPQQQQQQPNYQKPADVYAPRDAYVPKQY
ncbi:hypothetical protein BKA69DRAFT_1089490 [Paraphysoderma sedebokerense]|nr:hypothetical protein BKA69DRAFT_1089490 [Paraphysoderma sedebokerense]